MKAEIVAFLDGDFSFLPAEMVVKAARHGARIVEAPVSHHSRRAGRSKVSGTLRGTVLAARYILGVTLRYARQ